MAVTQGQERKIQVVEKTMFRWTLGFARKNCTFAEGSNASMLKDPPL